MFINILFLTNTNYNWKYSRFVKFVKTGITNTHLPFKTKLWKDGSLARTLAAENFSTITAMMLKYFRNGFAKSNYIYVFIFPPLISFIPIFLQFQTSREIKILSMLTFSYGTVTPYKHSFKPKFSNFTTTKQPVCKGLK